MRIAMMLLTIASAGCASTAEGADYDAAMGCLRNSLEMGLYHDRIEELREQGKTHVVRKDRSDLWEKKVLEAGRRVGKSDEEIRIQISRMMGSFMVGIQSDAVRVATDENVAKSLDAAERCDRIN